MSIGGVGNGGGIFVTKPNESAKSGDERKGNKTLEKGNRVEIGNDESEIKLSSDFPIEQINETKALCDYVIGQLHSEGEIIPPENFGGYKNEQK